MTKPAPAKYKTTNWRDYNAALKVRGSLLIWLDPAMPWYAPASGKPGHQATFSDAAIQFCLSIKALFRLALRQAIGMVEGLIKLAELDWRIPNYSTLSRRQQTLTVQIPVRRSVG